MKKENKKHLKFIAILLISLVLTLPFYSASVFAQIKEVNAKGSDNINGYIKEEDTITFTADIETTSSNQTIDPNDLWLGQNYQFTSCSPGINYIQCTLIYPSGNTTESFVPGEIPYTIFLKENGINIDSKENKIYVDNKNPSITSFTIEPATITQGNLEFKYTVNDQACDDSKCNGKCSGFKKIEFYKADQTYSEFVEINSNSCNYEGEYEKESVSFAEGPHSILARVYDNLGHVSDASSATFKVDNVPPQVDTTSFTVTDETGYDRIFASPVFLPVIIKVDVISDEIDKDNVYGDFSSIKSSYNNLKATCGDTIDDKTECTWQISLAIAEQGEKSFTIKARDLAGNQATTTIQKSFGIDSTGPVPVSITTDRVKDGKSYGKLTENNFIVQFTESEIGLNPNQVKLYVNNNPIVPDNCTPTWNCYWNNVNLPSLNTVTASIKSDTTDKLGNPSESLTAQIYVDTTIPRLTDIEIKNIGGSFEATPEYTKTGDSLQIVATLEDEAIETAYADLSAVITNGNNIEADNCILLNSSKWQCSWTTAPIDISGFIQNYINLKFVDVAGNILEHTETITVYGVSDEVSPNYWNNIVECSPDLIDRETSSLVNQKVFCHIKLKPLIVDDIVPVTLSLGQCSNGTAAVQEIELFNNEVGSRDPYIRLSLKKSNFNVDSLTLECPLNIINKVGNQIITTPEVEIIPIKFGFYNLPLGELSESVEDKITEATEDAQETIWKMITNLKKIMHYAERICRIIGIINNAAALVKGAIRVFSGAETAAKGIEPLYSKTRGTRIAFDTYNEILREEGLINFEFLNKFCGFVNCKYSFSEDGKWTGWLGSWQKGGNKLLGYVGGDVIERWTGKSPEHYMNPRDSIAVAVLTACIPGIIHNLDKWRQIQCMYAHCLQEGVKQQGLPVMACEDQKEYAECKYMTGEIFKVIPFTAFFDFYAKLIKDVAQDPLGVVRIVLGFYCKPKIPAENAFAYDTCATVKIFDMLGETIQDVTSMLDAGIFTIRDDYCDKLDDLQEEEEDGSQE